MYIVTTYYSTTGLIQSVNLSDFAYGEWIVYEDKIPKYHVQIFESDSQSNLLIKALIEVKKETIESIIAKINRKQKTKLSLKNKPFIKIVKKSELMDLKLIPLPDLWLKNISNEAFRRKIRIRKTKR